MANEIVALAGQKDKIKNPTAARDKAKTRLAALITQNELNEAEIDKLSEEMKVKKKQIVALQDECDKIVGLIEA